MPKTSSAALPVAVSEIDRRKQEAASQADISLAGAALSTTLPAIAVEHAARRGIAMDSGFFLTTDRVMELGKGIDPSLWDLFADAGSEDEANLIRAQLLDRQEALDRLAAAGATGTAFQLGAALTDPVYLGLSYATGGLGSFMASSGRASRVAMLGRAGLVGAAPAVVAEGYRSSQDPRMGGFDIASAALGGVGQGYAAQAFAGSSRAARFITGGIGSVAGAPADFAHAAVSEEYGLNDVLFNLAANFAMGGIGNALPGNQDLATAADRVIRSVQLDDVQKASTQAAEAPILTPKGEAHFAEQQVPAREARTLAEAMGLEPATGDVVTNETIGDTLSNMTSEEQIVTRLSKEEYVNGFYAAWSSAESPTITQQKALAAAHYDNVKGQIALRQVAETAVPPVAETQDRLFNGKRPWEMTKQEFLAEAERQYLDSKPTTTVLEVGKDGKRKYITKPIKNAGDSQIASFENGRRLIVAKAVREGKPVPAEVLADYPDISAASEAPAAAMGAASPNDPAFDPDAAVPLPKKAGDLDLGTATTAKSIRGWSWLGPVGKYVLEPIGVRVGQSVVPTWRRISAMLAKDVLAREGNTPSILSAPEWIESQTSRYLGDLHTAFTKGYKAHKDANGEQALTFEDFRNEVAKARRRQGAHSDPTIAAAARSVSPTVKALLDLQQRHGVAGAGRVKDNEWYTPRFWHRAKIDAAIDRIGLEGVMEGVRRSIAFENPDLRPAVVNAMAEAVIRNGGTNNTSFDAERALLWEEAGPRQLAAFLRQYAPDITDDEIADAIGALKAAGDEKATPTQLRKKIRMDETGRITVKDKNGKDVDFGIEDLLENDSLFLLTKYAHKSVRSSGIAEVYRAASVGLKRQVKSIPDLISLLREEAASNPANVLSTGKLTDQLEGELELIERMAKMTAGIPVSDSIKGAAVGRTIRNLNFIKSMSSPLTGIRNFAELAMGVSNAGLDVTFKFIPQAPAIIKQIATGDMSSQLRQELHALGIGLDRVSHKLVNGTVIDEPTKSNKIGWAEKTSARGARAAADISLQSFGTVLMNELNGRLILQKWANIARSGRMLSDKRLAGLGLDRAMADRVTQMLKDNAVFDKGVLVELNTHQWKDIEAATALKASLTKEATRIIQRNNLTEYAPWMTNEMGKLLMQLRTFNYGAHRGKLLYEVRMADFETFKNITSYTAVGGVVYAFTTYLDSIGREDAQDFLDKRLSAKSLALATFARSSYSAMLPTFVDAALESTGNDPAFGFQRTTGLPSAALFGNPTWDWANAASKLPAIVTAPFRDDYDFSKQDVENMKKGLWIPNFPPLVRIIEQLSKNLPDRSRQ